MVRGRLRRSLFRSRPLTLALRAHHDDEVVAVLSPRAGRGEARVIDAADVQTP